MYVLLSLTRILSINMQKCLRGALDLDKETVYF